MQVKLALPASGPTPIVGDILVSRGSDRNNIQEAFIVTGFNGGSRLKGSYSVLNLRSPLTVGEIPEDHPGYINVGRIESFVSERN